LLGNLARRRQQGPRQQAHGRVAQPVAEDIVDDDERRPFAERHDGVVNHAHFQARALARRKDVTDKDRLADGKHPGHRVLNGDGGGLDAKHRAGYVAARAPVAAATAIRATSMVRNAVPSMVCPFLH
jgi:hypothetical protein